jgi:hypothetical protein
MFRLLLHPLSAQICVYKNQRQSGRNKIQQLFLLTTFIVFAMAAQMSTGQEENAKKKKTVRHEKEIVKISYPHKFCTGQESNYS